MNQYYNFDDPAEQDTIVDAEAYNRQMQNITAAFDVIPSASQLSAGTLNFGTSTGANNHYSVTVNSITAMILGTNVAMKASFTSSGPADITLNTFPYTGITFLGQYVAAGDIKSGGIYTFVYDGQFFQCLQMSTRYFGNAAGDAATAAAREADALASRNAAAISANNAANSATTAASRVAPAQASATAAAGSASTAATRATAAAGSATAAKSSEDSARQQEGYATNAAGVASDNAAAAAGNASITATSATNAANSATAAAGSATTAANAATTAVGIPTSPTFSDRVKAVILDTEMRVGTVEFFAVGSNPATDFPGTTWVKLPPHVTIRMANATGTDVLTTGGAETVSLALVNLPAHTHGFALAAMAATDLGTKTTSSFDYGTKTTSGTGLSGTSSSFDYGTKTLSTYNFAALTTNNTGAHNHTVVGTAASNLGFGNVKSSVNDPVTGVTTLSTAGAHTHTFNMGAHSHTIAMGAHSHTFTIAAHNHTVDIDDHTQTFVMGSHNHSGAFDISGAGGATPVNVLNSCLMLEAWYRSI